jgi:hypothetical protein
MPHYDLEVIGARDRWTQIRWALFVFPDIVDVTPAEDPAKVRIFYEGTRAYPSVWRVELVQAGFDVPALEAPDSARTVSGKASPAASRRPRTVAPAASLRGSRWSSAARPIARARARGPAGDVS